MMASGGEYKCDICGVAMTKQQAATHKERSHPQMMSEAERFSNPSGKNQYSGGKGSAEARGASRRAEIKAKIAANPAMKAQVKRLTGGSGSNVPGMSNKEYRRIDNAMIRR